jgi:hypothetical protein
LISSRRRASPCGTNLETAFFMRRP